MLDSSNNKDSARVDSIYSKDTWKKEFKPVKTVLGHRILYKLINDSSYVIQWGDSLKLRTLPDTFDLDGHSTWIPEFKSENVDYIVLEQGCGSPCWIGYFLPLNDSIKPQIIHEYLGFNLEENLVAYVTESNIIEVINLKTKMKESHPIDGCESAFLGYCIDSLTISNKTLKFKWIPETKINSTNGKTKIEKIKI